MAADDRRLLAWALEDRGLRSATRQLSRMRYLSTDPAALLQVMEGVDWLREEDGTLSPTAGAIVADSTLGSAWACTLPRGTPTVTVRLAMDFTGRSPTVDGPLRAEPTAVHGAGEEDGMVIGTVTGPDSRVIALATLRGVRVDGPSPLDRPRISEPSAAPPEGPIDRSLHLAIGPASSPGAVVEASWRPSPWFGNVANALHGGVTAVVAGTLLRRVLPARHADLLHIDVAYLRPLPSDGTLLEATAQVTSRGRRFATVSGVMRNASGRSAALANATFGLG